MFEGTVTNVTLLENPDLCTLDTCPLTMAQVRYVPLLWGNILYAGIFAAGFVAQLGIGIRYKTWTYMIAMLGGLALEVVGYVARIQMHFNPFKSDPFLMYLVCLTIAPAFFSAAIYLCLSRIVVTYGQDISFIRPRTYTILFITCDFIALILQAVGGAIASISDDRSGKQLGKNIMLAGVSWQVFSMALFIALSIDLAIRVRRATMSQFNVNFDKLRATRRFKLFLYSLSIATLTIFVRSVFRCAELSEGFDGPLANDEITFMVLEGAMICIAVIGLTVFHPGLVWKNQWADAMWHVRSGSQEKVNYKALQMNSSTSAVMPPIQQTYSQERYYQ